jgi:hypothetical protein
MTTVPGLCPVLRKTPRFRNNDTGKKIFENRSFFLSTILKFLYCTINGCRSREDIANISIIPCFLNGCMTRRKCQCILELLSGGTPERKTSVWELKNELALLHIRGDTFGRKEKNPLKKISRSNQRRVQKSQMSDRKAFLNYAALAVCFMAIGAVLMYYFQREESLFEELTLLGCLRSTRKNPRGTSDGSNIT